MNTVKVGVDINLCHKRLGHISEKELHLFARNQYLPNLEGITFKACNDCLEGRIHRVAFHSCSLCTKSCILDLIHTNVSSMLEKTLEGAQYFLTFIDDHSRKVWASTLKTKDQVQGVPSQSLKRDREEAENNQGRKLW